MTGLIPPCRNIAKRGRTAGEYVASNAQRKTAIRHEQKAKQVVFTNQMKDYAIKQLIIDKWSPALISVKGKESGNCLVSPEWLYQWIWASKHGRRRRKRGNSKYGRDVILNRVSIERRPKVVSKRKRLGEVEVDLMMGKNHKGALFVMTDRASLHTRLKKLKSKSSDQVTAAIIDRLGNSSCDLHTLTFDNDKAFADHVNIGKELGAKTYFTRPYTSQDKGTVENWIGIIRRFFPKKTDLTFITDYQVKQVEQKLNNRPVRKFNYQTPNQLLKQKIALITCIYKL